MIDPIRSQAEQVKVALERALRSCDEHDNLDAAADAIREALNVLAAEQEKSERVFQAVVYAFEGKLLEIPEDLMTHGMVRRALKFRQQQLDALAARDPQQDEAVTTYTPALWATLSDDQRYEEYIRVRSALAARDPRPRSLSADEFEHLALMGRTQDGTLILGDGAAQRVLDHAKQLVNAVPHPTTWQAETNPNDSPLAQIADALRQKAEQERAPKGDPRLAPQITACVEDDGEIGIDFDCGRDAVVSFSLSATQLGFATLLGERKAYGRKTFDSPLPQHIIDHLKVLLADPPARLPGGPS